MFLRFLRIIFPERCFDCGKESVSFCEECFAALPPPEREAGKAAYALFDYRHPPLRRAIWSLKYKGNARVARVFAGALYDVLLERLSDEMLFRGVPQRHAHEGPSVLLIPLPRRWYRRKRYGCNQTELLARELSHIDGGRAFLLEKNALAYRVPFGKSQTKIKERAARVKNARGALTIRNPERVKGRLVILIDDIYTTGATIEEAKKTLHKAGAKKVLAYTIAH